MFPKLKSRNRPNRVEREHGTTPLLTDEDLEIIQNAWHSNDALPGCFYGLEEQAVTSRRDNQSEAVSYLIALLIEKRRMNKEEQRENDLGRSTQSEHARLFEIYKKLSKALDETRKAYDFPIHDERYVYVVGSPQAPGNVFSELQ